MKKFQNVSPIGALDIPSLNRIVEAGEEFEVPDDLVEYFESQPGNFAAVDAVDAVDAPKPRRGRKKGEAQNDEGEKPADDESTNDEEEASR